MPEVLTIIIRILLGFGSGVLISGGVIALITVIGVIPLMVHRSQTAHYFMWYENAIMLGALVGSFFSLWDIRFKVWLPIIVLFLFAFGIFVGALIIALAEVIDVFPIVDRRIKIKKGISFFVLAFVLGKLVGSLYYWLYPIVSELIR